MPFEPHQTQSINFFGCDPSFGAESGVYPRLLQLLFRCTFLYRTHFSLPVTIRSKNGSFVCLARREIHIETLSIKFSGNSWCGTQTSYLLSIPRHCRHLTTFDRSTISLSPISLVVIRGSASISAYNSSSSIFDCRPGRGSSTEAISPERNILNHLWHVLILTASSPYTLQMFLFEAAALLPFLNS